MNTVAHDPAPAFEAAAQGCGLEGAAACGPLHFDAAAPGGAVQGPVMVAPWAAGYVVAVPMDQAALGGAWLAPMAVDAWMCPGAGTEVAVAPAEFQCAPMPVQAEGPAAAMEAPPEGARIFMHDSDGALHQVGDCGLLAEACLGQEHQSSQSSAKIFVHGSDGSLQHIAECNPSANGSVEVSVLGRPRMAAPAPAKTPKREDLSSRHHAEASSDESTAAEPWWAPGRIGEEHGLSREGSSAASSAAGSGSPWRRLGGDTSSTPSSIAGSSRSSDYGPPPTERPRCPPPEPASARGGPAEWPWPAQLRAPAPAPGARLLPRQTGVAAPGAGPAQRGCAADASAGGLRGLWGSGGAGCSQSAGSSGSAGARAGAAGAPARAPGGGAAAAAAAATAAAAPMARQQTAALPTTASVAGRSRATRRRTQAAARAEKRLSLVASGLPGGELDDAEPPPPLAAGVLALDASATTANGSELASEALTWMVLRHVYTAAAAALSEGKDAADATDGTEGLAARARANGRRRRGGLGGAREVPFQDKRQHRTGPAKGSAAAAGSTSQDAGGSGQRNVTSYKGSKVVRSIARRAGHLQLQVLALYGYMQKWMVIIVLVAVLPAVPFALAAAARALGEPGASTRQTPVLLRPSGYSEHSWPTAEPKGRRPLVSAVIQRLDSEASRVLAAARRPAAQSPWSGGEASARRKKKPAAKGTTAKSGKASSTSERAAEPQRADKQRKGKQRSSSEGAGRPRVAAEPRKKQRERLGLDALSPEDLMDRYALLAQLESLSEMYRAYDL